MNRWLETDTQKTARNIINVLNESAAGMVKKEINKDKPEEAPKNKKVALEKRITRAAIKGKKPESKNAKMPKKIAKKVVKEELEPETKKSIEDQIADLQDYLDNTPEVSDEERAEIQAEIDDLISQLGEKEVDNKIMNESAPGTDAYDKLVQGDDVYFRNEEGIALLGHYADNYPEPEEYDEGYKPEYGGTEEGLQKAKEAAANGDVWEFMEVFEDTLQPMNEVYAYVYGQDELMEMLKTLRQVNVVKKLEENQIEDARKDSIEKGLLSEAVFEIDYADDDVDLSTEESVIEDVRNWLGTLANEVKIEVPELSGPAGGWPIVRLTGNKEKIAKFLLDNYNSGGEETLDDVYDLYLQENKLQEANLKLPSEEHPEETKKLNEKINHANDDINRAIANPNLGKNRDKIHAAGYEVTDYGLIKNPKTKKWLDPSQYSREEKKKVDFKGKLDSERKNNQGRYYPEYVPKGLKTGAGRGYAQADRDEMEAQNGISKNVKDYKAAVKTRDENRRWAERNRKDIPYYEKKVKDAQKDLEFHKNYTDKLEKDADNMENKRKEILDKARAKRKTESEELKEAYSDKLGGDPADFVSDVEAIKAKLSEIDTLEFGSHLAVQMVEDFIDTCDYQIEKGKRLASGNEFYTEADDRDKSEENLKTVRDTISDVDFSVNSGRVDGDIPEFEAKYNIKITNITEPGAHHNAVYSIEGKEEDVQRFKDDILVEADGRTYKDRDEAEYYRNKELYANSNLARHREAMEKAKKACEEKGIKLDEDNYLSRTRKEEPLDLVAYKPEITSIDEVKDKYVKIRGDFHKVVDVKPEGDKFVISFAAGTGTAIGGEFEPATLDEIKRLQLYTENK